MAVCLIGLGSNLGDRRQMLRQALDVLAQHPQLRLSAVSGFHPTRPAGGPPGQPAFVNAAATLETPLAPQAVLAVLEETEVRLGRRREQRWGPRSVDLDLLLYDQVVSDGPRPILPHPRMAWRRFVLEPAAEVAPAMAHPTSGWTIARLLDHLNTTPYYAALAGPIGVGKTHLAGRLAERAAAELIGEQVDAQRLAWFYADPSGHAWEMEIQFLRQRSRLLAADQPRWSDRSRLAVSDFWFEQSLAFAGMWLPPGREKAFQRAWREAQREVVVPRLLVLLDAPVDQLLDRIRDRGRPCELGLEEDVLARIRQAIGARAGRPGLGPVLRLTYDEPQRALDEVLGAVEAMK